MVKGLSQQNLLDLRGKTHAISSRPCPVCRWHGEKPLELIIRHEQEVFALFCCPNCESRFYDPFPAVDYRTHTQNLFAIRTYVEADASIEGFYHNLAPVLSVRKQGRYLDVGCGYGFSVDLARRCFGWDGYGIEPSFYGKIGSAALGFPLYPGLLTERGASGPGRFDVVHAAEVIEHVASASQFLDSVGSHLQHDGVAIFTTPSSAAVADHSLSTPARLAYLSPGSHTMLFSESALSNLFHRQGFGHVQLRSRGHQIVAYASRIPFELPSDPPNTIALRAYYEGGIARAAQNRSLATGFGFRLYRDLVHAGLYDKSSKVWSEIKLEPPEDVPQFDSYSEYLERYPAPAAVICYLRGTELLNFAHNAKESAQYFRAAFELAKAKIAIAPAMSGQEAHLLWNARFHQALALLHAGAQSESGEIVADMLSDEQTCSTLNVPGPSQELIARVQGIWDVSDREHRALRADPEEFAEWSPTDCMSKS